MRSNNRTRLLAAVTVVAALALAACGSDDDASSATDAPTATTADAGADAAATATDPAGTEVATTDAAPADTTDDTTADSTSDAGAPVEAPDTIQIAYQQVPNGDLIVKNQGWLEEAFGPDVNIEWNLFASGGDVNEAVIAGAVDIGLVGSSPASRGLSTGIEYTVPWIFDVIGAAEALVATPDITTIADLEGKTVATPFASTAHFSLLAALDDAGVDASTSTSSTPRPTTSTRRGPVVTSTPRTSGTRTWPSSSPRVATCSSRAPIWPRRARPRTTSPS